MPQILSVLQYLVQSFIQYIMPNSTAPLPQVSVTDREILH